MENVVKDAPARGFALPGGGVRRGASAALTIAIGTMLLMAAPLASGRPVIFSDTRSYYELGEQIAATAKLAKPPPPQASPATLSGTSAKAAKDPRLAFTVAGARSPTYALLFYLVQHVASAWGMVALQAAAMSAAIYILLNAIGRRTDFPWMVLGLSCLSSLPILIGFLMPDVFTALAACALFYFIAAERITPASGTAMAVALAFSLSSHLSNVLITIPVAIVGLGLLWRLGPAPPAALARRGGVVALAVVLAFSTSLAYGAAIRVLKHDTLRSPPFLTARLLEDGPGRRYLQSACANSEAYALCRYKTLPLNNANDVLWSYDPKTGVMELADYDTRVRLIKEQSRFVLGALRFDPTGVTLSAVRNFGTEVTSYKADESYADPAIYFSNPAFAVFSQILPDGGVCLTAPHACAPKLSLALIDLVMLAGSIASLLVIAALFRPVLRHDKRSALIVASALCFFILNAGVCGVLSGAAQRYQTRVEWLLPFSALLFALWHFRKDHHDRH